MRPERITRIDRRSIALIVALGVLTSWLVVQNGALLLFWSWPALPAAWTVARALLKVAQVLAVQLAPAFLVVGGAAMLWFASRRQWPPQAPRLNEVRHG